ncbi:MAG: hypothetical protein E7218_08355 [Anaerofustis stercorihominis]|nr:hypothetical protein [Anaerofustis stercorihominis]
MNDTAKWILGSAAVTAVATASLLMNKDRITKMGQEKLDHITDAKDDIARGMKDAAKDLKGMMR